MSETVTRFTIFLLSATYRESTIEQSITFYHLLVIGTMGENYSTAFHQVVTRASGLNIVIVRRVFAWRNIFAIVLMLDFIGLQVL